MVSPIIAASDEGSFSNLVPPSRQAGFGPEEMTVRRHSQSGDRVAFQEPLPRSRSPFRPASNSQDATTVQIPASENIPPPETQNATLQVRSTQVTRRRPARIPQEDLRRKFIVPGQLFRQTAQQTVRTNEFSYIPLADKKHIRILRIFSGSENDTIRCKLIPTPRGQMKYEALSYYWGTDLPTREIKITRDQSSQGIVRADTDELKFYIRDNLFAALRTLREPDADLDIWVDALCINQDDSDEKRRQIARMDDTYSGADNVIIWLGMPRDLEVTNTTILFIRDLCNLRQFDSKLSEEYAPQWEAFSDLLTNNWFSRRWVIQELALAKAACVQIGSFSIHWEDFADAVSMFVLRFDQIMKFLRNKKLRPEDPEPLREAKRLGPSVLVDATNNLFRRRNDNTILERQKTLETLISTLTAYEAADPRDTIYAVISIAKDTLPTETRPASQSQHNLDVAITNGSLSHNSISLGVNSPDRPAATSQDPDTNPDLFVAPELPRTFTTFPRSESDMQRFHGISADYEKDLLEVCKDFIKSSIRLSSSLDILCRNWAPVPTQMDLTPQEFRLGLTKDQKNWVTYRKLASWMGLVSDSPFGTPKDALNGRKNGDSLVGLPGRSFYNASNDNPPKEVQFKEVDENPTIEDLRKAAKRVLIPTVSTFAQAVTAAQAGTQAPARQALESPHIPRKVTDGTLSLKGMKIDVLYQRGPIIVDGVIPEEALILGGWISNDDPQHPDYAVFEEMAETQLENGLPPENKKLTQDWVPDELCRTLVADRNPEGENAPRWYLRACRHAIALRSLNGNINTETLIENDRESIVIEFLKRVRDVTWNRMLFRSEKSHPGYEETGWGRLGLAPKAAKQGDIICILFGCSVPVLLRKRGEEHEDGYIFIGECYLHGVMDGEAVPYSRTERAASEQTFLLY